jgi:hypothetical protein
LGIYDGVTWTTYHVHTANLYIPDYPYQNPDHLNYISELFVFGDGPPLPALEVKAPGLVRGKLVSRASSLFIDAQVEICLRPVEWDHSEGTPCADQAYHALSDVNTDGSFVIPNVPIGSYYLMIKLSNVWGQMAHSLYTLKPWENPVEFLVRSGEETQLGEISTP